MYIKKIFFKIQIKITYNQVIIFVNTLQMNINIF